MIKCMLSCAIKHRNIKILKLLLDTIYVKKNNYAKVHDALRTAIKYKHYDIFTIIYSKFDRALYNDMNIAMYRVYYDDMLIYITSAINSGKLDLVINLLKTVKRFIISPSHYDCSHSCEMFPTSCCFAHYILLFTLQTGDEIKIRFIMEHLHNNRMYIYNINYLLRDLVWSNISTENFDNVFMSILNVSDYIGCRSTKEGLSILKQTLVSYDKSHLLKKLKFASD